MRRKRRRTTPPLATGDERRVEALTVAMALAPGVYARNRMFELFAQPVVKRARARAATLRGIVRQLPKAQALGVTDEGPGRSPTGERTFVLRFAIPAMRLTRVVELSPTELAALRMLAARAGVPLLPVEDEDRLLVETALARLLEPGEQARELAQAAQDVASE